MNRMNLWFYIKKYRLNSVLLRNAIAIVLIITISFGLISFFVYQKSVSVLENETDKLSQEKVEKLAVSMNSFIKSMDRLCIVLLQEPDVQQVFSIKESTLNLSDNYMKIMDDITMFTLSYEYIKNISVYSALNNCIISQAVVAEVEDGYGTEFMKIYKNAGDGLYISTSDSNGAGIKTATFTRKRRVGNETLGAVCIEVHLNKFFEEIGVKYNDINERFMIADQNGKIILSSYLDDINKDISERFTDGKRTTKQNDIEYLSATSTTNEGKWQYLYLYNEEYYNQVNDQMIGMAWLLVAFVFVMGVLIAVYISEKTFRPLAEIVQYFRKDENAQQGDINEIGYIMRNILMLTDKNANLTEEMQERIVLMNKAQLKSLQSQINPHFMYNTLETIKWVVMDIEDENDMASSMIEMLAEILKYSLDMEHYLVKLNEEIEYTKSYINILKLRHGDRFDVIWNIDPELEDVKVLKLCLQPIIENAMTHGILPKRMGGTIEISIRVNKKDIIIEIKDDGVGIDNEKLEEIYKDMKKGYEISQRHIGLKNVDLRTKLVFGDEYGSSIASECDKGTVVTLRMRKMDDM